MWADHVQRWPTRQRAATDHSDDPPECGEAIGRVREAEQGLSSNAEGIEQQNRPWRLAGGLRAPAQGRGPPRSRRWPRSWRLSRVKRQPARLFVQVADAIRYTYCFQPENYTQRLLRHQGTVGRPRVMRCTTRKNYWTDPEYKGINTRWVTPEGQRFEVQFHTPDSFHAKHNVTHAAYERIRDPRRAEPNCASCTRSSARCRLVDPGSGRRRRHSRLSRRKGSRCQTRSLTTRSSAEDRTVDNPCGLVRRLEHDDGPSDEALRKDFSWKFTPVIVEWERGDFARRTGRGQP